MGLALAMLASSSVLADEAVTTSMSEVSCHSLKIRHVPSALLSEGLMTAMCRYFDAENAEDWSATYGYRTGGFRAVVSRDLYDRLMSKAKRGFDVRRMDVRQIQALRPAVVRMSVDFYEMPEDSDLAYSQERGFAVQGDELVWVNDGQWHCGSCGHRGRYSLNHGFGVD